MPGGNYDITPPLSFNSHLKQQNLKSWQPILTATTVLPKFFLIGLLFIPTGIVLLKASNNVKEYIFDYTDICNANETPCKDIIKNKTVLDICQCQITIQIDQNIEKPVFVYYGLTNFYQNHRLYAKSRDDRQLLGEIMHTAKECEPFRYDTSNNTTKPIGPCGAVANSMFNDTFNIINTDISKPVNLLHTDISWPSDKEGKFSNPKEGWTDAIKDAISKPPYWRKPIYDLGDQGLTNEHFMVWMRTAALPTFRKLYGRVEHERNYENGIPAGNYTISIDYNYPVDSFHGRKRIIISNTSWAGGKNAFLGLGYIVVGSLSILMGLVFLLIHIKYGKLLMELTSLI